MVQPRAHPDVAGGEYQWLPLLVVNHRLDDGRQQLCPDVREPAGQLELLHWPTGWHHRRGRGLEPVY